MAKSVYEFIVDSWQLSQVASVFLQTTIVQKTFVIPQKVLNKIKLHCVKTHWFVVKLQSKVQTSVLGLGVDFVLPLSQQEQEQEEQQETRISTLT